MITVGSIITANDNGDRRYICTRKWGLYKVTEIDGHYIHFTTIASDTSDTSLELNSTWYEDSNNFVEIDPREWLRQHPSARTVYNFNEIYINTNSTVEGKPEMTELRMIKNDYTIPQEQLDFYKKEIMELLPKYRYNKKLPENHYAPTEKGVNAILNEYAKNKGWMYPYFMSHPNYIGNGKIAFSADYHRKVNVDGVRDFISWCINKLYIWVTDKELKINGMTYSEVRTARNNLEEIYSDMISLEERTIGQSKACVLVNNMNTEEIHREYDRINNIYNMFNKKGSAITIYWKVYYVSKKDYVQYTCYKDFLNYISENPKMLTTADDAEKLNSFTKELDLRIVSGQKMSRIIGKFCRKLGIDKDCEYNQKFAKLGDDINELDIKRHTIISINPVDYLTMSFGNSWKSCHTIDKFNDRAVNGDEFGGCYSGGTLSYMLDEASIVYYTVDSHYNNTLFELEPKVNRCMFHLGEDKLIQGRVYPQCNDGDQTIYTEIRNIMQKVTSEMFNTDNLWTISRGTDACCEVINTVGLHYPDYENFSNCNVSYLKPNKNKTPIKIGHKGICPKCGETHNNRNSILCYTCERDAKICPHCGSEITSYNASITVDGTEYCASCAHFCEHHQRWEIDTSMINVFTSVSLSHSGRSWYVGGSNVISVCNQAIEENPTRYRRDFFSRKYIDTQSWTTGCIVYNRDGNERRYYAFKELAKRDGYKETHTGKWYREVDVFYDRRTKKYYHISEWNIELNCAIEIENEVRAQQEMLARRAERREARRARREAIAQNVA